MRHASISSDLLRVEASRARVTTRGSDDWQGAVTTVAVMTTTGDGMKETARLGWGEAGVVMMEVDRD
jgi:hypothetical protein